MRKIEDILHQAGGNIWNVEPWATGYSALVHLPDCGTGTLIIGYNEDVFHHVSVSPIKKYNVPTWDDMALLKQWCFEPEEEVYQIHPAQKEYINIKDNCLHLWQPANGKRLCDLLERIEPCEN